MKIAIVHDYLITFGGAERVLVALHEMYPEAPIYVSIYRKKLLGKFAEKFKNAKIIQAPFGFIPFAERLISPLRFLIPLIWKSIDLTEFDLVISSASWAVTKGFKKKKGAVEICYCHTPPRYLYGYDTSRRFKGLMGRLVKVYGFIVNHFMLQYDYKQAQKVDFFIANSLEVKKRIEKFYRRDSTVIYPPVEIVSPLPQKPNFKKHYLTGGRLTAAKNFDLIIEAFNKLKLPLKIYGKGALGESLTKIAEGNIEFLGGIEDSEMPKLHSGAKAFILAQKDEDFGITAIEAMGFGIPVIAFKGGGYLESVTEGKTGVFFDKLTSGSLEKAVKRFEKMRFKPEDCVSQARKFSKERFEKEIKEFINKHA